VAELVHERWVRGGPVQIRSGFGCDHALVEQEDLGAVVAEAGSGLLVRAGDGSRCADGDSGGLGQLGDGRVDSVADDVVAAGLGVFRARRKKSARSAAWTVAQCCRPVASRIRLPASSRGELRSTPAPRRHRRRRRRRRRSRRDLPPALRGAITEQFARAGAVNRAHVAWLSAVSGVTGRTSVWVPAACSERLAWPPLRPRR